MKPARLIAALVLLAALGGYAWWSDKHPPADTSSTVATPPKIFTVAADQIQTVRIAKTGADPIVLNKRGNNWTISAADGKFLAADSDTVTMMTGAFNPLTSERLIDEHPANLTSFGLDKPVSEIDVTLKGGKTQKLLLGSDTPSGSSTYAKLEGDSKVYTISAATKASFDKSVDDLRDKRLLTFNLDKITSVTLNARGGPVEFSRTSGGDWQITKPKPLRADGAAVDQLIGKLKDAAMDLSAGGDDMKATAAVYASGTKVGTATIVDSNGPQTIEVHKAKDNSYYAKSSVVDGVFKVTADTGTLLDKTVDDFRNKKLFDFGFTDPAKVDLGGKVYEKTGDKWFTGSTQIDSTSIQDVVDKLRDLAASKFADKISGTPALTIAITWGEKNKVDKVVINKNGADYVAARDGDTTAYALDSKSFDDLQTAIAGIKPYIAPAAKK